MMRKEEKTHFLFLSLKRMNETKEQKKARLNRDRVQRHRLKLKRQGLVKVEVYVLPQFRKKLLDFAKGLSSV